MAYFVEGRKILFFLTPRTASSALSTHFRKNFGGRWIPEKDVLSKTGKILIQRKHSTFKELEGAGLLPNMNGVNTLAVVRNPFDSLVSLYTKQRGHYAQRAAEDPKFREEILRWNPNLALAQELSFSEWVLHHHPVLGEGAEPRPSANRRFTLGCDHILRFESLEDDFRDFCTTVELPYFSIAEVNKTAGRSVGYREMYDDRARERVLQYFKWDTEVLGYEF